MLKALQQRDALMRRIRAFFNSEGFVEVETPIRLQTPCMELHIDAEPSGECFLRTSPELSHKKLLACGAEKIFEVAKCFRQGERGRLHNPEYTMLEWYRTHGDYMTALHDTRRLLEAAAAGECGGASNGWTRLQGRPDFFSKPWTVFTVAGVFEEFAGWNPVEQFDADRFDLDLVEKVEPALPQDGPVVLKDFPAELCALARLKPGNPGVAERWELYLDGIEIANAYSELTDPVEQRARFETWAAQRRAFGKPVYDLDEEFFLCLEKMPDACGVALGLDRLLMILTGAESLDGVIALRSGSVFR
jgi:lysyl-tRNA synthetase class 2